MRKTLLIAIIGFAGFCAPVYADVVAVPAEPSEAAAPENYVPPKMPSKGESMAVVVKLYGQPQVKHKAAGGGSRRHPPITRWDYDGYSVFFEHGTVIDAVARNAPKSPVAHTDELKPVEAKPAEQNTAQ